MSKTIKKIFPAIWFAILRIIRNIVAVLINIGRKIPVPIWGAIATIALAVLTAIVGPIIVENFKRTPMPSTPTPTLPCISESDILVTFHILRNEEVIAILHPLETASLESGLIVYFQANIKSASNKILPALECTWTNTGIATDGLLLRNSSCTVDYRIGQKIIRDAVSVQLSQPSCPALAPYPLFIMPSP